MPSHYNARLMQPPSKLTSIVEAVPPSGISVSIVIVTYNGRDLLGACLEATLPQAEEAGCFVDMPDGWGGSFRAPAAPVRFPGTATGPAGPAPKLGEHTRQVLREAGYEDAAIEALIASGAAV